MKMTRRNKIAMATVVAVMGVVGAAKFAMPGPRPDGPPQKDMTIDATVRAQVVEQATAELEKRYVFPKVAATLDRQLHEQLRHGDFDGDSSAQRFAEALTQALRRDTHDGHLEVVYFEHPVPVRSDDDKPTPQEEKEELLHNLRLNYGLAEVKRLQGDIGYIDVHAFGRLPGAADRIAAAMDFLADTNALIIDLRRCGGGDPDTVMAFASYLFDKPTHLNDIWFRDDN